MRNPLSIKGVGNGTQSCTNVCSMPIAVPNTLHPEAPREPGDITRGESSRFTFDAPTVTGSGASLPALLGLKSICSHRAVLEMTPGREMLTLTSASDYTIHWGPGCIHIPLERAPSGHLIFKTDAFANLPNLAGGVHRTVFELHAMLQQEMGRPADLGAGEGANPYASGEGASGASSSTAAAEPKAGPAVKSVSPSPSRRYRVSPSPEPERVGKASPSTAAPSTAAPAPAAAPKAIVGPSLDSPAPTAASSAPKAAPMPTSATEPKPSAPPPAPPTESSTIPVIPKTHTTSIPIARPSQPAVRPSAMPIATTAIPTVTTTTTASVPRLPRPTTVGPTAKAETYPFPPEPPLHAPSSPPPLPAPASPPPSTSPTKAKPTAKASEPSSTPAKPGGKEKAVVSAKTVTVTKAAIEKMKAKAKAMRATHPARGSVGAMEQGASAKTGAWWLMEPPPRRDSGLAVPLHAAGTDFVAIVPKPSVPLNVAPKVSTPSATFSQFPRTNTELLQGAPWHAAADPAEPSVASSSSKPSGATSSRPPEPAGPPPSMRPPEPAGPPPAHKPKEPAGPPPRRPMEPPHPPPGYPGTATGSTTLNKVGVMTSMYEETDSRGITRERRRIAGPRAKSRQRVGWDDEEDGGDADL
eukprot:Skav211862  [mRNA]  locus=scaffold1431:90864:92780:- [translate_table: standard]